MTSLNVADVLVTNTDNDTAGITGRPTSGLVTREVGGAARFAGWLNSPIATVQFDGGEGWDSGLALRLVRRRYPGGLARSRGDGKSRRRRGSRLLGHAVVGFKDMHSYPTRGGVVATILHGSSGSDELKSHEDFIRLRAKNSAYSLGAKKSASIVCDPGAAGSDAAVFDGTDGSDISTYHRVDNFARMQGKRRDHSTVGFGLVNAQAGGGESSVAYFKDMPGAGSAVDGVSCSNCHKTELVSSGAKVSPWTFNEVHAMASESGFDVARVRGTLKDEHFECDGSPARLYRKLGTQLDPLYEVTAFERVKGHGSEGNDTKDVRDHTFELFFSGFGG